MEEKVIELIKKDIARCEQQTVNEGSYQLYQALMGKYNGLFPGFSDDIPKSGKVSTGGAFNYRPELNAIKEVLELKLITEQSKDPLFEFKNMFSQDIDSLKRVIDIESDVSEGLYSYFAEQGFYDEVEGTSLDYNLQQIYNKLCAFKALNYPGLDAVAMSSPNTVVNITNNNENKNTMNVTFDSVRKTIDSMTSLPEEDIEEIKNKISALEEIVNSKESKSKKWSKAKDIIKWVADKGVDVGIALLPLILKIG